MKKCFKCSRTKPLEQFYKHPYMGDGYLGKCKTCAKKDSKARWNDPEARERIREYDKKRFKDPLRKAKILKYHQNTKARRGGVIRARYRLGNAIRDGHIERKPCEVCKNPKSEGHHTDYRKPLTVKWLCFKHHREEHGQKPVTL